MTDEFTDEQKRYLEGFAAGTKLAGVLPTFSGTLGLRPTELPGGGTLPHSSDALPAGPESIHFRAQDCAVATGGKLCPEEQAKRKRFPLDIWDDMVDHARRGAAPKGTDVLAFKYHGLFWVAPAQDSFMCRLRFPGGIVPSYQMRGVTELAQRFGGGYSDVTTRANLQIRQIKPADTINVLHGLHELGIVNRGAGADNVRNITGSPTAGIDPQELIDTRPLCRELHHYILNHRELYGLPRKFNIAFDGGGAVSCLEDTNDIGFAAVRVGEGKGVPAGVYFRLTLGGITGHKDFARETGVLVAPDECVPAAVAVLRAFIDQGDRTDRKKARLKYVLDRMGLHKFLAEVQARLPFEFRRLPTDAIEPRPEAMKHGHLGVHPQKQPGLNYLGVVLAVGRMTDRQMRGLADLSDRFGSGTLRLTVWQNLLVSDVPDEQVDQLKRGLVDLGLGWSATAVRGGLVACTGAAGCKYAAAHTKEHARQIADYLETRIELDLPVNVHVTGCPHSCAQHYIGDIGLLATKVGIGEDMVEGYHLFVGGGYGAEQGIGREIYQDVTADRVPPVIERMLRAYLENRAGPDETFRQFVMRFETEQLKDLFERRLVST